MITKISLNRRATLQKLLREIKNSLLNIAKLSTTLNRFFISAKHSRFLLKILVPDVDQF